MDEIRDVSLRLLGYKDNRTDRVDVYDANMGYLGRSDINGTFDKYGGLIMRAQHPDMLLTYSL